MDLSQSHQKINRLHERRLYIIYLDKKLSFDELLQRGSFLSIHVETFKYWLQNYIKQKQPPEVFYKKAVFKNLTIFTGKHLCWSLFLVKLRPEIWNVILGGLKNIGSIFQFKNGKPVQDLLGFYPTCWFHMI